MILVLRESKSIKGLDMNKVIIFMLLGLAVLSGCASKFDQRSYDRQNNASEKSQNQL